MGRLGAVVVPALCLMAAILPAADWSTLEEFQGTITRAEFARRLQQVYAPTGAFDPYLAVTPSSVRIYSTPQHTEPPVAVLRFRDDVHPLPAPAARPTLNKLRIAIDPGHIGGEWARMEERFFAREGDLPVMEGVLTLTVARLLKQQLAAAGTQVVLTREELQPVTSRRPGDFIDQAWQWVRAQPALASLPGLSGAAVQADAARARAELLFYRHAEIAARAELINSRLKPDLTLCLHFNAVPWDDCQSLVDDNRVLVFVHGHYLAAELVDDAQKLRLLQKLLAGDCEVELPLAEAIASSFARRTGLPPVEYAAGDVAVRVGANPYVYARNLAASRLYDGPVVYLEPYYMNSRLVYQRLQLGDYEGERTIAGRPYPSIFREYAAAVGEAVIAYFGRPE